MAKLNKSENKILNLIKIVPAFIILVLIIIIFIIFTDNKNTFNEQIKEVENESILEQKDFIKREVESVHTYIQNELENEKLHISEDIRNRVYEANSIATSIYENNRDKDEKTIKKLIVDALKTIRFNDNRGYFFIYELDGTNVMHPLLPKLEGTNLWDFQDKNGLYLIRELKEIAQNNGEGYLTWWWNKPNDEKNNYEKIGFIKAFQPYNWYIGTGEYIVDYEEALKKEVLRKIDNIRFGKNGYIFVIDKDGDYPSYIKKNYLGLNRPNLEDKNGQIISEKIIDVAKKGEGFVSYQVTHNSHIKKIDEKISFIKGFEKWGWAIGAGIYLGEIEDQSEEKKEVIRSNSEVQFNHLLLISFSLFVLVSIISVYFTDVIKNKFLEYNKRKEENTQDLIDLNKTLEQKVEERTKELIEQQEQSELLFNETSDGLTLIKNGEFIKCNDAILKLLNFESREEFLKKTPAEMSPEFQPDGEKSEDKAKNHIENCIKNGHERFEWIHLNSNGEEIWFEIVITKIKIKDEIILHTVWRDIKEKKTLEKQILKRSNELLEQKNMFETLVDAIPDIVWMKDIAGVYLQCNKRFTDFFGAKQRDILGKTDYDFVNKELADSFRKNDNYAMNSPIPLVNFEIIPFASDGHEEYTQTVKTAVKNKEGNILGILGIGRDFTKEEAQKEKLKTIIEELKLTQDKLVEAEKMSSLGVLVAGIAHEVNTPIGIGLTGATHFLEITKKIKKDYDEENMSQDEFENYINSAREIATLINSNLEKTAVLVRNFKQISFDQSSEEKRKINLKEYIDEILFSMNNITRKTNISIENNCNENINILTYPGAISQIITNLIINSIRHGFKKKEAGKITIIATSEEKIIKLVYKDNGQGIKKENLSKIFDPFFTTNRQDGGTGLGLNILYNIISNTLNGTIHCKSEENNGVEFIILFQENENIDILEKDISWGI